MRCKKEANSDPEMPWTTGRIGKESDNAPLAEVPLPPSPNSFFSARPSSSSSSSAAPPSPLSPLHPMSLFPPFKYLAHPPSTMSVL